MDIFKGRFSISISIASPVLPLHRALTRHIFQAPGHSTADCTLCRLIKHAHCIVRCSGQMHSKRAGAERRVGPGRLLQLHNGVCYRRAAPANIEVSGKVRASPAIIIHRQVTGVSTYWSCWLCHFGKYDYEAASVSAVHRAYRMIPRCHTMIP